MNIQIHEFANLFPLMTDEEFKGLLEDIKNNGQIEPIWLYQEKILDGRNRYLACCELGIEPKFQEWTGTGSPVSFVSSKNLHRRHLTQSQRAMVAAKIKHIFEDEAKKRQEEGRIIGGYARHGSLSASLQESYKPSSSEAAAEAAKFIGVSTRGVYQAQAVLNKGIPEVVQAVEKGTLSLNRAVSIVSFPPEKQADALKNALEGNIQVEIIEPEESPTPAEKKYPYEGWDGKITETIPLSSENYMVGDIEEKEIIEFGTNLKNPRMVAYKEYQELEDASLKLQRDIDNYLNKANRLLSQTVNPTLIPILKKQIPFIASCGIRIEELIVEHEEKCQNCKGNK